MTRKLLRLSFTFIVFFIFYHNYYFFSQNNQSNDYVVFRIDTQPSGRGGERRLEGEIVNLTGRDGLTFRPNNGQEIKISVARIIDLGTVKDAEAETLRYF